MKPKNFLSKELKAALKAAQSKSRAHGLSHAGTSPLKRMKTGLEKKNNLTSFELLSQTNSQNLSSHKRRITPKPLNKIIDSQIEQCGTAAIIHRINVIPLKKKEKLLSKHSLGLAEQEPGLFDVSKMTPSQDFSSLISQSVADNHQRSQIIKAQPNKALRLVKGNRNSIYMADQVTRIYKKSYGILTKDQK